jgi:hypothetical protein
MMKDIPPKLALDFVEAKGKLQHTLFKLTNAEQTAIDYLGVEFILAKETKQFEFQKKKTRR